MIRVIHLVAWEFRLAFVASTAFVNKLLTSHAWTIVTHLFALVLAAGQESLAEIVTDGHRLDAGFTLATKETLNSLMAAGTVDLARWIFLTWLTLAIMARLFTIVMPTVEKAATGLLARKAGIPAE